MPVPGENITRKEQELRAQKQVDVNSHTKGQEIEHAFQEYVKAEFQPICEPIEYYNGFEGEGFQHLEIQKLSRGFTQINHGGWEGWGIELLMPEVRLSEIKNLIILLAYRSGVESDLFEEVKSAAKNIPEEKRSFLEILSLEMFWIKVKSYPSNNNALKWAIEFDCATS